jgi:SpoVK/Ycf46/Vps4 family AAA+-type ATPase
MQAVKITVDAKRWMSALQEILKGREEGGPEETIILRLDPAHNTLMFLDESADSTYRLTMPVGWDEGNEQQNRLYCRVFIHKLRYMLASFQPLRGKITLGFRRTTLSLIQGKKHCLIPNHFVPAPLSEKEDSPVFYKRHYDPNRILRFTIPDVSRLRDVLRTCPDTTIQVRVREGRVRVHTEEYRTDAYKTAMFLWPYESFFRRLSQLPEGSAADVAIAENGPVYMTVHAAVQAQGTPASFPAIREIVLKPLPATTLYISKGDRGESSGHKEYGLWTNTSLLPAKGKKDSRPDPLMNAHPQTGEGNWQVWSDDELSISVETENHPPDPGILEHNMPPGEGETSAMDLLECLPGLNRVKKQIRDIADFALFEKERMRILGVDAALPTLHMCFLGNPGTGKTMVARMLGRIFRELGLLQKGHVVEVDRQALVGAYMGHTEANLLKYVKRAMGGILFIDEAYALYKKDSARDFGLTAINGLVKLMEDYRDRLIVVLAGYKREMFEFLTSNPGLRERIPFHLEFPDYTEEELVKIAEYLAEKDHYQLSDDGKQALLAQVLRQKVDETFGNARTVRNCLERAKICHAVRVRGQEKREDTWTMLTAEDFADEREQTGETMESIWSELEGLVGLEEVKRWIRQLADVLALEKKRWEHGLEDEPLTFHMAFTGNPGTGKTTVARLLGKMLRAMKILPRGHFVEVTRKDLVAGYMGQTAIKTAEKIREALGGVLFIDEAYALARNRDDFGAEALATLIKEMEDQKGKLAVIFAGYTEEMEELWRINPGLKSRIRFTLEFPDFTASELVEIVRRKAEASRYRLTEEAEEKLWAYFIQVCSQADESFGNGRLAEKVFERAKMNLSSRIAAMPEVEKEILLTITEEDIPSASE